LLAAGVAALVLGGVGLAAALVGGDGEQEAATVAAPKTVQQTVTLEGTTVVQTVTTAPPATSEPPATTAEPEADPAALNDQGFALMQAGDYEGALPLLEQAVAGLAGSGSTAEAYASYNLAFTRLALGSCDGVVELLDRSEQVQGERKEISRLRKEAERSCEGN
jgi:tetratricopeptide (TPR) repeat protein